jgi:hypothetical protein
MELQRIGGELCATADRGAFNAQHQRPSPEQILCELA